MSDTTNASETRRVWAVTIGDRTVQVRDLPVSVVAQIAKETGIDWVFLVDGPMWDVHAAELIVHQVAEYIGPDAIAALPALDAMTVRQLVAYFDMVDDDLPDAPPLDDDQVGTPLAGNGQATRG